MSGTESRDRDDATAGSRVRTDAGGEPQSRTDAGDDATPRVDLAVLSLVTAPDAGFYRRQVDGLAALGVETTTLSVPGRHRARETVETRSAADYLRFVPEVRSQPLDEYDLVHANYGLTAPAALAQRRLPVVCSLWGSDLAWPVGPLSRAAARFCDAVVVMNESMAASLGTDCAVVPHGVDLDAFRPIPKAEARERVGWARDRRYVFFPYPKTRTVKNYPVAERVVAAADERLAVPVELVAAGGRIPHGEMPAYMSAADAMLLPSDREGSPNTVKEAMACNLPVVATDVGDVAERLDGVEPSRVCASEAGLVDALVEVLRKGGRSNGREAAREVGVERTAERLLAVYESVVDDAG